MPPSSAAISIARALGGVRRTLAAALVHAPRPAICLLACSGGPDSAALLGLVERLVRGLRLRLVVAHVDHGRRAAARAEAALVSSWVRARGHEAHRLRLALADGPGWPARARAARRAALQQLAAELGAHAILLGHTATDQAETVILHLCRGTGVRGLAGMSAIDPPATKHPARSRRRPDRPWVRPLLELTRVETRALAIRMAIPFVDDPSNHADTHPRTRVREQVLPVLASINPAAIVHIAQGAALVREAAERGGDGPRSADGDRLDARALRAAAVGTRRTEIRELCLRAGIATDALGVRTVAAVDLALRRGLGRRRWDLHGRRTLRLEGGWLWVEPTPTAPPNAGDHGPDDVDPP